MTSSAGGNCATTRAVVLHPRACLQVRSAATAMLQTAAVSAEALGVLPGSIERGLRERLLPPLEALSKKAASNARDMPQVRTRNREACSRSLGCASACLLQHVVVAQLRVGG